MLNFTESSGMESTTSPLSIFANFSAQTLAFNATLASNVILTSKDTADHFCSHFYTGPTAKFTSPGIDFVRNLEFHFILPAVAVLGLVGNTINLFVLRSFTGRTFFYLFWLAVSDLSTMFFDSLFSLGYSRAPNNPIIAFLQCHFVPGGAGALLTCSNFIVVVLTVDRFRAVCYPIETRAKQKNSHAGLKVFLCFISALIVFSPIMYLWEVKSVVVELGANQDRTTLCYLCQRRKFSNRALISYYGIVLAVFSKIIPILIVASINIAIVVGLNKHQTERSITLQIGPVSRESAEDRLKVLIMTITTVFIVCLTPLAIRQLFFRREPRTLEFAIFKAVSLVMIHLNTACNFYVYCFCSEAIRNRLREICRRFLTSAKRRLAGKPALTASTTPSTPSTPGTPNTGISMISLDPFTDSKL